MDQQKINKLKKRNQELRKQHGQVQKRVQKITKRVETLQSKVRSLTSQNVGLAQEIEKKIYAYRNQEVREKQLQKDLSNLELSHVTIKNRLADKANELNRLERKLRVLEQKKDTLIQGHQESKRAMSAIKVRKTVMETKLLSLDDQLRIFEAKLEKKEVPKILRLKNELRSHAGKDQTSAGIVLTVVDSIIKTMEENEFENLTYRFKVNSNKKEIGTRVQFQNVESQMKSIKERLYPIMQSFKPFFEEIGVKIKTKAVKSESGIVNTLDIAVVAPKEYVSRTENVRREAAL